MRAADKSMGGGVERSDCAPLHAMVCFTRSLRTVRGDPMRMLFLSIAIMMAQAGSAHANPADLTRATPGYLYFSRPGADLATHNAELTNCMLTWMGASGVDASRSSAHPIVPGLIDGWVADAINDEMVAGFERARRAVNIEHCMVVRGWRVIQLSNAEGARLAALTQEQLQAELTPWIGALDPPGTLVRVWRNEAASLDTAIFRSPQAARRELLSARAIGPQLTVVSDAVRAEVVAEYQPWSQRRTETGSAVREITLTEASPPPEGFAVLIMRVVGSRRSPSYLFSMERSAEGQTGMQDYFHVQLHGARRDSDGRISKIMSFLAPAGEWRLHGARQQIDYCLGAPSFTAGSGDVIFLGEFDFDRTTLAPDLGPEAAARTMSAGAPMTSLVQPASWTNGATWPCRMELMYSLEFEGFPYRPGYSWGGAYPQAQ